jgi:hypothetical protein
MAGLEQILSLFQHSAARASRSTALNPLLWVLATLMAALVGLVAFRADTWLVVGVFSLLAASLLATLIAYGCLAWKNPDALRSEKYTLTKMALEKSMKGDNLNEFVRTLGDEALSPALPPPEAPGEGAVR